MFTITKHCTQLLIFAYNTRLISGLKIIDRCVILCSNKYSATRERKEKREIEFTITLNISGCQTLSTPVPKEDEIVSFGHFPDLINERSTERQQE